MKLAQALTLRKDLQIRMNQLVSRLNDNAKVQEGLQPNEDPYALLKELEAGTVHRVDAQAEVEKYWIGALRRAAVEGDVDHGSLMAGQSVGLVNEIMPVKTLIEEILIDADAELISVKNKLA